MIGETAIILFSGSLELFAGIVAGTQAGDTGTRPMQFAARAGHSAHDDFAGQGASEIGQVLPICVRFLGANGSTTFTML